MLPPTDIIVGDHAGRPILIYRHCFKARHALIRLFGEDETLHYLCMLLATLDLFVGERNLPVDFVFLPAPEDATCQFLCLLEVFWVLWVKFDSHQR